MTQGDFGRHRGDRQSTSSKRRVAVGLLVVAVVGSVAATAWAVSGTGADAPNTTSEPTVAAAHNERTPDKKTPDKKTPEPTTAEPGEAEPRAASTTAQTPPAELVACEQTVAGADQAVRAADSGLTHWMAHVQARTDLLAGKISLEEVNEIFGRTRLAGPDDLKEFDPAYETYQESGDTCGDLSADDVPEQWRDAAQACLDRQPVAANAAEAAKAAIDDWRSHLANMRKHRNGGMTSAMAQQEWLEAWRNAPPNINGYNDAVEELSQAPACAL